VLGKIIRTYDIVAIQEINALDTVVKYAQSVNPDDEFIVMGDLNADCSYFNEDSTSTLSSNDYYWCIDNSVDSDGNGVPDGYNHTPKDSHVQTKEDVKTPGFSAIFAIGSVLAVAFGVRRKR
jgi:hypothetical protein